MKSLIYYYKYPQYIWAKEIGAVLASGLISKISERKIIDAPCGDGVISYWLKKMLPQLSLNLFDLDESLISTARAYCGDVSAEVASIYDLELKDVDNVWLLINSLYCLPDKEKLLDNLGPKVEYIIAIFPHLDHKNYQYFLEQHPGFANPSTMSKPDTIDLFSKHSFKLISMKDITFIPPYAFKGVMRLAGLTKRILNIFDPFFYREEGSYWLAVFIKE